MKYVIGIIIALVVILVLSIWWGMGEHDDKNKYLSERNYFEQEVVLLNNDIEEYQNAENNSSKTISTLRKEVAKDKESCNCYIQPMPDYVVNGVRKQ